MDKAMDKATNEAMDKKLEQIAKGYFDYVVKEAPHFATQMGIHDYDEEMPSGTLKSTIEFMSLRKKVYEEVKSIDPAELSFDGQISRGALMQSLAVEIFNDEKFPRWRRKPFAQTEVGAAVYVLFVKEFAPFEERIRRIISRLQKTPQFLKNSKELLDQPVKLWIEAGIGETASTAGLLDVISNAAREEKIDGELQERLDKACESAKEALKDYETWLREEVLPLAGEEFAMGEENFRKMIDLRQLDMSIEEIHEFGEKMLKFCREKLEEVSEMIAPGKGYDEVKQMMMNNHPATYEEALEETRREVENARRFVVESDFATLPGEDKLEVIETPSFLRSVIPFGAYNPPGRFDRVQTGFYLMSRPDPRDSSGLQIHNYGAILNTSVHEAYPGHHLQMVCANHNPYYSRILMESAEFVEGWAHYCEETVAEMGFRREPSVMFERYADMYWRASRIIVDIKLSGGEMGYEEAIEFLQKISGFDRGPCKAEIDRYTYTPGYQLSYLIGKKKIMDLRKDVQERAGSSFSLKKFHDAMLSAGSLPSRFIGKVVHHAFGLDRVTVEVGS